VREQAQQARDEARDQVRQTRDDAREQVRQAKEQAREQARQAREDARGQRDQARESGEYPGPGADEHGAGGEPGAGGEHGAGGEGPGPEAARRVHEQARQLREEARRARDEAMGGGRLGDPVGARFHSGEHDWDPGGAEWGEGPGWTDWPGRRGWEDWARMRGRHGWPGSLDFGTLRDLERVAVQFTSDLRRVAMQSSVAGENVISDLRTILEDALERIKSEIFGSGPEAAQQKGAGHAEAAAATDAPGDDTPPAGGAGKPGGQD